MLKTLNMALKENISFIELRLDTIKDIDSILAEDIIKSIKEVTSIPIILTNRTKSEGGYFEGSEIDRISILRDNAHLVEYTDIELSTQNDLRKTVIDNANKTIISYHNFDLTPSKTELQNIVDESFKIGDIPKIAVKPLSLEDTFVLSNLIMENKGIIGISMDKLGCYTRILGPVIGSPITYAAIDSESAPGQLNIKTTDEIIRTLKY